VEPQQPVPPQPEHPASHLCLGLPAAEDGLDVVAIRIEHEGSVVVWRRLTLSRTRWTIVCATRSDRGGIECIDLGSASRHERGMLSDACGVEPVNPEDWIFEAVSDSVSAEIFWHLRYSAQPQRAKSCIVEDTGGGNVRHAYSRVINHWFPDIG
jgi:hypothetical protein